MRQLTKEQEEHVALVKRVVRVGDVLTHTRCAGCVEEHEFLGWSGQWMRGRPTRDTFRFNNQSGQRTAKYHEVNDIHPVNVTHIQRAPVDVVEMLAGRDGK